MVLIVYPWAKCAQYSCCQMRLWLTYVRRSKLTTFIGYVYVSEVITIDCLFKARVLIRKISYLDLYCSSFLQNECVEVVKDLFGIIADMYFHGCKIGKKAVKISWRCWCTTVAYVLHSIPFDWLCWQRHRRDSILASLPQQRQHNKDLKRQTVKPYQN